MNGRWAVILLLGGFFLAVLVAALNYSAAAALASVLTATIGLLCVAGEAVAAVRQPAITTETPLAEAADPLRPVSGAVLAGWVGCCLGAVLVLGAVGGGAAFMALYSWRALGQSAAQAMVWGGLTAGALVGVFDWALQLTLYPGWLASVM